MLLLMGKLVQLTERNYEAKGDRKAGTIRTAYVVPDGGGAPCECLTWDTEVWARCHDLMDAHVTMEVEASARAFKGQASLSFDIRSVSETPVAPAAKKAS